MTLANVIKEIRSSVSYDPKIRGGQPVIKGTRILVSHIVEYCNKGWSKADIKRTFSDIDSNVLDKVLFIIARKDDDKEKKGSEITWHSYSRRC